MTIKEIAALAGTSRGTVDRVLNERGNVKKELSDKIHLIAKEHNYTPNQLARALINSRKRFVIGVVINSVGNPFFDDVLSGIYRRANYFSSHGLEVIVEQIKGYNEIEQLEAIDRVIEKGIDALAIMPLEVDSIKEKLKELALPIVTFNTDIKELEKLAFVGCDYSNSGRISGDIAKLILSGGGKVGIVIGSFNMQGHKLRVEGMRESLAESENISIVDTVENFDDDVISYKAAKQMIEQHDPDLIYFGAAGVRGGVQAVLDSHKKIYVITVDEIKDTRDYLQQGIISATVTQQPIEQGERTINILYNYLVNKKLPKEQYIYTENKVRLKNSI